MSVVELNTARNTQDELDFIDFMNEFYPEWTSNMLNTEVTKLRHFYVGGRKAEVKKADDRKLLDLQFRLLEARQIQGEHVKLREWLTAAGMSAGEIAHFYAHVESAMAEEIPTHEIKLQMLTKQGVSFLEGIQKPYANIPEVSHEEVPNETNGEVMEASLGPDALNRPGQRGVLHAVDAKSLEAAVITEPQLAASISDFLGMDVRITEGKRQLIELQQFFSSEIELNQSRTEAYFYANKGSPCFTIGFAQGNMNDQPVNFWIKRDGYAVVTHSDSPRTAIQKLRTYLQLSDK